MISALHDKMAKAKAAILAEFKGLDVTTVTALRKKFRDAGVDYKVVKNTLAIRAAAGTSVEALKDYFKGPIALVMGYADPVTAAKLLADATKDNDKLVVKGGVVEGALLDAKGVSALAKLPGIVELRGRILGVLSAPASKLVRLLATPGGQLARVIDARREALSKQG